MPRQSRLAVLLAVLASLVAMPAGAREEIPAERRESAYSAKLESCDAPSVLSRIQSKFRSAESSFWQSDAQIIAIEGVRQVAFRPHGLDLIPRRYCAARAVMHDRRKLALHYAIIEGAGIVGMFNDVQFCLDGYDRNHTAPPGCHRLDR